MRLHRESRNCAVYVYGVFYHKESGYKSLVIVEFHRWQWVFEFGCGDRYDW